MTIIRRVQPDDWQALREIRLRALRDIPSAFGSTYDEEVEYGDQVWRERAASGAGDGDQAQWFAVDDQGLPVGVVRGSIRDDQATHADLWSMWVAPEARRQGLGRRLVAAVEEWATAKLAETLVLWVTSTNEPARRLYEDAGFAPTGESQPLPSDRCREELALAKPLTPATR